MPAFDTRNWPDFKDYLERSNTNEQRLNDYYSQSMMSINKTPDLINVDQAKSNQSPEALAPLGSNANVINKITQPNEPNYNGIISLTPEQLDGMSNDLNATSSSIPDIEWSDEGNGIQAINDPQQSKGGAGVAQGASAVIGFAGQAYGALEGTDKFESESWKKTGSLAMSGASTGMMIGGPWGAAIGAGGGGAAGIINMGADRKKRHKETRDRIKDGNQTTFEKRQRDYQMKEAEREIELLTAMSKSQLNYLK